MKSTILITLFTKVVKTAAKQQQVCTLVYSVQSTTAQLNYNRFFSPFAWNLSEIYWSGMTKSSVKTIKCNYIHKYSLRKQNEMLFNM